MAESNGAAVEGRRGDKTALITGITGQDGSYLAELLLDKGYEVHGLIRRASTFNTHRIDHLYIDPHDPVTPVVPALRRPDRRLPARDARWSGSRRTRSTIWPPSRHVRVSFDEPEYTGDVTGLGTTRLLEAIREVDVPTAASTRPRRRRCSARRRRRRMRPRRSIRARPMARRRSTRTG